MKILHVVNPGGENPYVESISTAMQNVGVSVVMSTDYFFSDEYFDIIHFHWPEALTNWQIITDELVNTVKKNVRLRQSQGAKVIYTYHNDKPHYVSSKATHDLYRFLEQHADGIIHLGDASMKTLSNLQVPQTVIPHQTYNYQNKVSKKEARSILKIKEASFVILVFGKIRNFDEQKVILSFHKELNKSNKLLLVPRWKDASRPLFSHWLKLLKYYYVNRVVLKYINGIFGKGSVKENDIQLYFNAADILFLPRTNNVNSGLIPLAFSFGLPVVGFNSGNIGSILSKSNNFVLNDLKKNSISELAKNLKHEKLLQINNSNYEIAKSTWGLKNIVEQTLTFYNLITGGKFE